MQKWEYITVEYKSAYGITYRINGDKNATLRDKPLHVALSMLGSQGWELVYVNGSDYIFKRPAGSAKTGSLPIIPGLNNSQEEHGE